MADNFKPSPTIIELRDKRRILESTILTLIEVFEKETDVDVTSIDLEEHNVTPMHLRLERPKFMKTIHIKIKI